MTDLEWFMSLPEDKRNKVSLLAHALIMNGMKPTEALSLTRSMLKY